MDEIVGALGWKSSVWSKGLLALMILVCTLVFLLGSYWLEQTLQLGPYPVQIIIWITFLFWLGYLFPLHHYTAVGSRMVRSYRSGFYRHILPGICLNFAQLLCPLFYAVIFMDFWPASLPFAVVGLMMMAIGSLMILLGLHSLGIAGAMFIREYQEASPNIISQGIYGLMRHPLFTGGILTSFGTAVFLGRNPSLTLGFINLMVLPAFVVVEDKRCGRVFGTSYREYSQTVGAVLPELHWISSRKRQLLTRIMSRRHQM